MAKSTRREFLGTAAAAATVALGKSAYGAAGNRTLKIGVIGVGWYGMVDAKAALKAGGVEIVAVCDVDSDHLRRSADELEKLQGSRPQTFKLYADLLEAKEFDVVIIATPPHWHALQFIAALERGLDVYCEKPLAYDIREGRAMVDAARRHGRVVQIGFQRRQSMAFRQVQAIHRRRPGRAASCRSTPRSITRPAPRIPRPKSRRARWIGTCGAARAPRSPTATQVGHFNWRLEKTSGHGHLVDWGIHLIDAARTILGETMPLRITAAGGLYRAARQDHHARHAHRELRVRPLPGRLAASHLGGRRIHAGNQQRPVVLRRAGDGLRHRRKLGRDSLRQE